MQHHRIVVVVVLGMALAGLLLATMARAEPTPSAATRLVDVATLVPGIRLEMRYATADNFLNEAVYPCARCLLTEDAAAALGRVEASVAQHGLHLKVWDCYRPQAVQKRMWQLVPDARFVANPAKGSNHSRGAAVDLTLVDANGSALEMPTAHDDFTEKARADAPASAAATTNRAILRAAMEAEGFSVAPSEWWHFSAKGRRSLPLLDAPLCEAK